MATKTISASIGLEKTKPPPALLAWAIWGLCATLYLIGFYQRVAPAVMTDVLMADFGITAATLGNLSAFYFYSYVLMQIPTGILSDSWGPRRLLAMGGLVTGAGTLLFALAPTIFWANLGRLLIGGAVAVAFVGMLKLASHWFAPRQFAMASGLALFVGVIGAVSAGVPLQWLITAYGWRAVMVASAFVPLAIGLAIWLIVRDDPEEKGYISYAPSAAQTQPAKLSNIFAGLKEVFRYRNMWLLFLIPGGIVGPVLTFSGLWGVSFLTTHYNLPATQAAALGSMQLVAWAVSGPILGRLSDRIGRRKPLYVAGCAILVLGWSALIFLPQLPYPILVAVLISTGLASGCMVISFALVRESVPPHLAGTAIGACNMGVMLGPMLLQPGVGWLLDQQWQGQLTDGIRVYGLAAYQNGFSLMLAWTVLAFVLVLLTKETHCRQTVY